MNGKFFKHIYLVLIAAAFIQLNGTMLVSAGEFISLPDGLITIEEEAFYGDESIGRVVHSDKVKEIQALAFADSSLSEINLPESIVHIDDSAFNGTNNVNFIANEGTYAYEWLVENHFITEDIQYPESQHPYQGNSDEIWNYKHPVEAEALSITFNTRTFFESECDYLIITDGFGKTSRFSGACLAGQRISIAGNSFSLRLLSDSSYECYGFSIDNIEETTIDQALKYPETSHPYENDANISWNCTYPLDANSLRITFDEQTEFEDDDYLTVTDSQGEAQKYTGKKLSGVTLHLRGQSFALDFTSNSAGTAYGFSIADISPSEEEVLPEEERDYDYEFIDGTAIITNYHGNKTVVTLPSEINGVSVTEVGSRAFQNVYCVTEVVIPEGYTKIHDFAFGNNHIKTIHMPDTITAIDDNALFERQIAVIKANKGSFAYKWAYDRGYYEPVNGETSHLVFEYSIGDNECIITGYDGTLEYIKIPEYIEDVPVTAIGDNVFRYNRKLRHMVLPESVRTIGINAFSNCVYLETIEFPSNLETIGNNAFSSCGELTSINNFVSAIEIGNNAFSNCTKLEQVSMPENVIKIGKSAYHSCISMKSIELNDGLKEIGDYAFSGCYGLQEIRIPDSVVSLGELLLSNDYGLKSVIYGGGLKQISTGMMRITDSKYGDNPYDEPQLEVMVFREGVEEIEFSSGMSCFPNLQSVELPNTLKRIGENTFSEAINLKSIYLPDNITDIGESAFESCINLTIDQLPKSLKNIEDYTFCGCDSIQQITIPNSVEKIGSYAFFKCDILENITLLPGLKSIGFGAFASCPLLKTLEIPDTVNELEEYIVSDDTALKTMIIGGGIQKLPSEYSFGRNISIDTLIIGEGIIEIESNFLYYDNIDTFKNVYLPSSLELIGKRAFYNAESIEAVYFPEEMNPKITIGSEAFSGCKLLKSIHLPNGTDIIGSGAFNACEALEEVIIPESVDTIESYAFDNCSKLASITLSEGIKKIEDAAFRGCTSLSQLIIPDSVTEIGGSIISGSGVKYLEIGGGITEITESPVGNYNNSVLEEVKFREGVKVIGNYLFAKKYDTDPSSSFNPNLKKVTLPSSIERIGDYAFNCNKSLETVEFSGHATNLAIGNRAFSNCTNLKSFDFPVGIETIGGQSFENCESLTDAVLPFTLKSIGKRAFYGCNSMTDLTLDYGLQTINEYAFANCSELMSVIIPDSVKQIEKYSFFGCEKLTNVILPRNVTMLNNGLFMNCISLREVTIRSNLVGCGIYVFENCTSITTIIGIPGSKAETLANSLKVNFEEKIVDTNGLSVSAKNDIIYVGVGQTVFPELVFSDGAFHSSFLSYEIISGSSVGEGTLYSLLGQSLGDSLVKCTVIPTDTSCILTNNTFTIRVRVVYSLPEVLELAEGDSIEISPVQLIFLSGDNPGIDFQNVVWSSENTDVADVDENLYKTRVYGVKQGESKVTVRNEKSGAEATILVKVGKVPTKVEFSEQSPYMMGVDEEHTLQVHFGLEERWNNLVYFSSDTDVAEVSADGTVTAKSKGTAEITAKAGAVTGTLTVQVTDAPEGILFVDKNGKETDSVHAFSGVKVELPQIVFTNSGAASEIVYECSNSGISCHEQNGYFIAVKSGRITARTYNGLQTSIDIQIKTSSILKKLQEANASLEKAKEALRKKVNTLNNNGLSQVINDFDTYRDDYIVDNYCSDGINGIQIASVLPKKAEMKIYELIAAECKNEKPIITGISGFNKERKIIEKIYELIFNDAKTYTVVIDDLEYVFSADASFGKSSGFAEISLGTVTEIRNGSSINTTPIIVTVTDYAEIQKFLDELEKMAKTKLKEAISSAVSDGWSAMGVDEAFEYMKDLYETDGEYVKAILVEGLDSVKSGLSDAFVNLITGEKSAYKEILDLKAHWKEIKSFVKDNSELLMKAVLKETGIMSSDDINELESIIDEIENDTQMFDYAQKAYDSPKEILSYINSTNI